MSPVWVNGHVAVGKHGHDKPVGGVEILLLLGYNCLSQWYTGICFWGSWKGWCRWHWEWWSCDWGPCWRYSGPGKWWWWWDLHEASTHEAGVSSLHVVHCDQILSEVLCNVQQLHGAWRLEGHFPVGQLHVAVKDQDVGRQHVPFKVNVKQAGPPLFVGKQVQYNSTALSEFLIEYAIYHVT